MIAFCSLLVDVSMCLCARGCVAFVHDCHMFGFVLRDLNARAVFDCF